MGNWPRVYESLDSIWFWGKGKQRSCYGMLSWTVLKVAGSRSDYRLCHSMAFPKQAYNWATNLIHHFEQHISPLSNSYSPTLGLSCLSGLSRMLWICIIINEVQSLVWLSDAVCTSKACRKKWIVLSSCSVFNIITPNPTITGAHSTAKAAIRNSIVCLY